MADLSNLTPTTTVATALGNLVLVTPQSPRGYQPQNPTGLVSTSLLPTLMFHYEGEQTVALESDITDHFIENNTALQDQIALKPEKITTHGFIGELNDVKPSFLKPLEVLAEKLTFISAYTPALSQTAIIANNEAFFFYQTAAMAANVAVSAWDTLTGGGGENIIGSNGLDGAFNPTTGQVANHQTKQQIAFQQFYGYWVNRYLFTVQTPWAIFTDMAIMNLRAIQDDKTRMISDFEITFKKIRTASTTINAGIGSITGIGEGRFLTQNAGLTNLGTSTLGPQVDFPGIAGVA